MFSFTAEFSSEESCRTHFKGERDKIGLVCHKCSHTEHYWKKVNGIMNVKNVEVGLPSVATPLSRAQIYHF